jgi:hypothetical protein
LTGVAPIATSPSKRRNASDEARRSEERRGVVTVELLDRGCVSMRQELQGRKHLRSRLGEEREHQLLETLRLAHVHHVVRFLDDHFP